MQIDDRIKQVIAVNGIAVQADAEYTEQQLLSLYSALILFLADRADVPQAPPREPELDPDQVLSFKREFAGALTGMPIGTIIGYYGVAYLESLPAQLARVVCEALAEHAHRQGKTIPQLWLDVLAGNGAVPHYYRSMT